jgi:hypothetical protein
MEIEHSLKKINLEEFGFVNREKVNGKTLTNKCGRDFLYYSLNYYFPELHNSVKNNPQEITKSGLFGWGWLPAGLVWTGLTFKRVPKYLKSLGLKFTVNNRVIKNYLDFFLGTLPLRPLKFEEGISLIEKTVDDQNVVGVDISMALGGLADHIMFVYGYDKENLYVFDTHQAGVLEYIKMTSENDNRFIMKLPKNIIRKRWTIFNRVWVIEKI